MKYLLILMVVSVLLVPGIAGADVVTYEEAWSGYLYRFPLSYRDGSLALSDRYRIWTGNAPTFPEGSWTLWIENGKGVVIASYRFAPANGDTDLIVPAENSGATAKFMRPDGTVALTVDLRGSRVCNDDGVCNAAAGERYENCSSDCGGMSVSASVRQTATIASQVPLGTAVGNLVLRLAFAGAGLMLLFGAAHMLDSNRRQ